MNESRIGSEKFKATIAELNQANDNKDTIISQLKDEIEASNLVLAGLNEHVRSLEEKLSSIGQRNDFMENEIQYYRTSKAINSFSKRDVNKLKRNPDQSLYLMFLKNKAIGQKDSLISSLHDKLKEYIRIIDDLRDKLNSCIKT